MRLLAGRATGISSSASARGLSKAGGDRSSRTLADHSCDEVTAVSHRGRPKPGAADRDTDCLLLGQRASGARCARCLGGRPGAARHL